MSPHCYSCGSEIPEGQGTSCSMCYGDPFWGSDGYYLDYLQQSEEAEAAKSFHEELCPDCNRPSIFYAYGGEVIQVECSHCDWFI